MVEILHSQKMQIWNWHFMADTFAFLKSLESECCRSVILICIWPSWSWHWDAVCLCDAVDFPLSKIWEKALMIWWKNYHPKGLGRSIFKFQICRTNVYWDDRCFMLWRYYVTWPKPCLLIVIPAFFILHRWKNKINNLFMIVFYLKNVYKWPLNLRIRYKHELWGK